MANITEENKEELFETPIKLVELMIKKAVDLGISPAEILDNSYGNGNILKIVLNHFKCDYIAFDIIDRNYDMDVNVCDYLKERIEYNENRIAFINPPWTKGLKFCYKALEECSTCIAILSPNSIFNLDHEKYDILSCDLIKQTPFNETVYLDCLLLILKKK